MINDFIAQLTHYTKYARYIPTAQRRETFEETVERNERMHYDKYPDLRKYIKGAYRHVYAKKILPSMRSMQFAGKAIELSPNRIYNCAFLPIDHRKAFRELLFLLLGGSGVGYSVQFHHVSQLPEVRAPKSHYRWVVQDSKIGWANALDALMKAYFGNAPEPDFDFNDVRPKGSILYVSGGRAPGPDPLRIGLERVRDVLRRANGRRLRTLEVHDICCHIADMVLAGGIRRAALIALFSFDDMSMRRAKWGEWWIDNPQRARANNSAMALRHLITKKEFYDFMADAEASKSGEPGIYFSNRRDWGANPCVEIGLRPNQFCNLVDVNGATVEDAGDFMERVVAAATISTMQAGYTDFHYLRPIWKHTTEREALIGVGITGIASGRLKNINLPQMAKHVLNTNEAIARIMGINPAARATTIKPSGTTSLEFSSEEAFVSSGIHNYPDHYFLRRSRYHKTEPHYQLLKGFPFVEDLQEDPHNSFVISLPVAAPQGAPVDSEVDALDMLERVKRYNVEWVREGHRSGDNYNNVSATIHVKDHEWETVTSWMWDNRDYYNGLAVFPYNDHIYTQAPFEPISKEKYDELSAQYYPLISGIDFASIIEQEDGTALVDELACAGNACAI